MGTINLRLIESSRINRKKGIDTSLGIVLKETQIICWKRHGLRTSVGVKMPDDSHYSTLLGHEE